ncbi:hypothetical protein M0R45_031486 [Rubus argutus]|uniref:NFD4 C-terminal domain-containing protein n=1 Tax=Rubus argutus TaxID=59490 RepID=A0AAW1WGI9_RUBAR
MTLFPARARIDSSDHLAPPESSATQTDPLLTPSSSATNLGSFHETDDASDVETLLAIGEGAVKKKKKTKRRGEDFKFQEAFIKADFWLLWFVYFLGVGSGVTVLNNLSQIGVALGSDDTTILLSLFSFCNFVGRLGSGVVSEHFVKRNTLPRTFWMACAHILMILSFLLYALALNGTLYVATALLGNPVGAVLFSVLLAGNLYDTEAAKQGTSTCIGADCFRITFLVLAGVCGLGTILSIILTVRVRPVYQMLYAGGSFRLPSAANH